MQKQAVDPTSIEQNQSKATEEEKVMQNGNKNSEQDQGRRKPGERSTGLVEGRDGPASKVDTQQQDKNAKVGDASGAIQNKSTKQNSTQTIQSTRSSRK